MQGNQVQAPKIRLIPTGKFFHSKEVFPQGDISPFAGFFVKCDKRAGVHGCKNISRSIDAYAILLLRAKGPAAWTGTPYCFRPLVGPQVKDLCLPCCPEQAFRFPADEPDGVGIGWAEVVFLFLHIEKFYK